MLIQTMNYFIRVPIMGDAFCKNLAPFKKFILEYHVILIRAYNLVSFMWFPDAGELEQAK